MMGGTMYRLASVGLHPPRLGIRGINSLVLALGPPAQEGIPHYKGALMSDQQRYHRGGAGKFSASIFTVCLGIRLVSSLNFGRGAEGSKVRAGKAACKAPILNDSSRGSRERETMKCPVATFIVVRVREDLLESVIARLDRVC